MPIEEVVSTLTTIWQIIENWWWVVLPFVLWKPVSFLWLWWRIDLFLSKQRIIILEIKLPKILPKPIRAMEVVLSSLQAAIYHPPDLWEKWIDGQIQMSLGLEMVAIDGEPHFFVRTPVQYKDAVESSLYSQYSEIEIVEAEDYTKYIPQSIPNKEWDMFGCDYKLLKDDHYPIKTYTEFETEQEKTEEKKIDPIAGLLEAMAKIKKGEQLWIQLLIEPIGDANALKALGVETTKGSYSIWQKKGEALRDKLARRDLPPLQKPIIQGAAEILISGLPEEKKETKEFLPPEMKLTPGEREILSAIEHKMSKPIFSVTGRFIYLGKRDVWFKPNFRLAFSFFNEYTTTNLNALFPDGRTLTKIKKSLFFPLLNNKTLMARRHYLSCRKLFRNYIKRFTPFFPRTGGTYMLSTEEIASIFHFPSQETAPAPGVQRIESKKGTVPSSLPMED